MAMVSQRLRRLSNTTNLKSLINIKQQWPKSFATSTNQDDSLFAYTSGRWIYNESLRMSETYLRFNVPALSSIIATSVGKRPSDVISFVKLAEGTFNRVFQATLSDGQHVLARLPYPSTVPKHYATASEVATMQFLRQNHLPVPQVHGWSSTADNDVGAEYIIMEAIGDFSLLDIWPELGTQQRGRIVKQLVSLERNMFNLQLPASGSIYFPGDLSPEERSKAAMIPMQGEREYCMGPVAHYSWWRGERSSMSFDRGPWTTSTRVFQAVGAREFACFKAFAEPRLHSNTLFRTSHKLKKMPPESHIAALKKYLEMADFLGYTPLSYLDRPVLRHPDLSLRNIRVSESLDIVGLIDWQHASVLPFCLAAGIPSDFQSHGTFVSGCDTLMHTMKPPPEDLPAENASASVQDQAVMKHQHDRLWTHFLYAFTTMTDHPEHFKALATHGVTLRQSLYESAGFVWEGDSITLQAYMISALQQWQDIASFGSAAASMDAVKAKIDQLVGKWETSLPTATLESLRKAKAETGFPMTPALPSYSDAEVKAIMELHQQQLERDAALDSMRDALGVDSMGWVPSDEHWWEAKQLAQRMKERMMSEAEDDEERDEIRKNFLFDDRPEDE